jgi:hypothetical protein
MFETKLVVQAGEEWASASPLASLTAFSRISSEGASEVQ